jgi:hypothetical protein
MDFIILNLILTPLFSTDRIFDQDKMTQDIFDEICKPVITGFVQGFHG